MVDLTCPSCRKTFFVFPSHLENRGSARRACSNVCRGEMISKHPKTNCRWCQEPTSRRGRLFCSPACRGAYQQALKIPRAAAYVRRPEMMRRLRGGEG